MAQVSYYATIPSWVLSHKTLSYGEKVMCALLSAMSQRDGYCFASNEALAEALGTSEGAVIKILTRLDEANVITIAKKKTKKSGNRQIRLVFAENLGTSTEDNDGKKFANGAADQNPNDPFDRFYEIYPRKEKKIPAQKMFKSKKLHSRIDDLLRATKNYARKVSDTDQQFIMLPSTFLNNQIWEEYIGKEEPQKFANGAAAEESADPFDTFVNRMEVLAREIFNSGYEFDDSYMDRYIFSEHEKKFMESAGGFAVVLKVVLDGDFKKEYRSMWDVII